MAPSCLIDDDDRCGPNQYLLEYAEKSERCVCVEGTAFVTGQGCVPCGEHESASGGACVCDTGYVRTLPTDPCTELPQGVMPPTGQDKPCTSDADCAGLEAAYCDTFVSHSCLVQNCTLPPNDNCFQGKECCDLSNFGLNFTLCIAAGACVR